MYPRGLPDQVDAVSVWQAQIAKQYIKSATFDQVAARSCIKGMANNRHIAVRRDRPDKALNGCGVVFNDGHFDHAMPFPEPRPEDRLDASVRVPQPDRHTVFSVWHSEELLPHLRADKHKQSWSPATSIFRKE
jgi:hypothetical protein